MEIKIEIEDPVYHKMEEIFAPVGITVEQFIERVMPSVLATMVANPQEYDKMVEAFFQADPEIASRLAHRVLRKDTDRSGGEDEG